MIQLLVVSDNRMFIRRVLALMENQSDIHLHFSFHSTDIFEAYLQYHPDAILLDGAIYLPLSAILNRFAEYRWDCPLFITGTEHISPPTSLTIFPIDLEQRDIVSYILQCHHSLQRTTMPNSLPLYVSSASETHLLSSDLYYLMLLVCLDPKPSALKPEDIQHLKSSISKIGQAEICSVFQQDVIILMRKTKMKRPNDFIRIHKILTDISGHPYSALYEESVPLEQLDTTCQQLLEQSDRCYCLGSQCCSLAQLKSKSTPADSIRVYSDFIGIISCFWDGTERTLIEKIQSIYYNYVIPSADLSALNHLHKWLAFSEKSFLKKQAATPFQYTSKYGTAAQECELLCQHWRTLLSRYQKCPYRKVTEQSIFYILEHYADSSLTLDHISRQLGFAKTYISRMLKEDTGISFSDLLLQLRMEYSVALLQETALEIQEIAGAVGYADAQYFSKVFRRYTGFQPSDYRKLNNTRSLV